MKLDLLQECNDQHVPPKEFMETFCKRCRNKTCVNAGWSQSTFEERVGTQVERLLTHPMKALADDPRFEKIRAIHFKEIAAAIILSRQADPWAVQQEVHLAEPDSSITTSAVVEDAVQKLSETRGKAPPAVLEKPQEAAPPRPVETPRPAPKTPPVQEEGINTSFPEEGVMIGGPLAPAAPLVDPWAPKPKMNVVPRGAKIKMSE